MLHHETFDPGAFTVREGVPLVSDPTNGTSDFRETLLAQHAKPLQEAQHPDWRPDPGHLDWHGREVFIPTGLLDPEEAVGMPCFFMRADFSALKCSGRISMPN